MHELSITQSLIDAVVDRIGERKVIAVNVQVGPLSGVLPDAMRFCFDVASAGTALDGAQLVINEPRGLVRCRSCHDEFEPADPFLLCPCGSADVEVLSGRELMLMSVEVA